MKIFTKKILLSSLITAVFLLSGNSKADGNTEDTEDFFAATDNAHESNDEEHSKEKQAGWYMKMGVSAIAEDGTVFGHNTAGIFGKLKQSKNKKDQHDILGFGTAIIQVVFPQTDWDEDNGDYFSDYRHFNKESPNDRAVWTFQVNNQRDVDLAYAPLTITLDGSYRVTYTKTKGLISYTESKSANSNKKNSFTLIDIDNQLAYSHEDLQTAELNMDGLYTRTFRWVLGDVDEADYDPLYAPEPKTAALRRNSRSARHNATHSSSGKFGYPPQ